MTLENVMGLSAISALHRVYHANIGITTQPRMRPITWKPQAGRGCPQDDGLADNRRGLKVGNGATPGDHRAGDEAQPQGMPTWGSVSEGIASRA